MRRIVIATLVSLAALCANAQDSFSIKGELSGDHEGKKVILQYPNPTGVKEKIRDSTYVKNGQFIFHGKLPRDLTRAQLIMSTVGKEIDPADWRRFYEIDQQWFLLENKKFTVTGSHMKGAKITGGAAQSDFRQLQDATKEVDEETRIFSEKMQRYYKNNDHEAAEKLSAQGPNLPEIKYNIEKNFLLKHPDSYASLYILEFNGAIFNPEFETLFNGLSQRIKNTDKGRELSAQLAASKRVGIGNAALDFVMNDTQGNAVSLASLKGKYILLDFWASWCGPCRDLHPTMLKAYQKYKDKNFEIIAVSLDNKREHWLKAIEADGLPWIQLSDLKGLHNAAAILYGVTAIPDNFLIDPNGNIIAKELRGVELERFLDTQIK